MSVTNKLTGKAGSWTYTGTTIPFSNITPTDTRSLANTTDSTDYDAGSDMLWESQLPVKEAMELKVEGFYATNVIPTPILAALFSGAAAAAVVITLKSGTILGHGNFDISDFEAGVPVDDTITYSVTLKLNGIFTAGS